MAGTLDFQIRPPSQFPSPTSSEAISLISPLQEEIDIVTELDMSVRTTNSFNSPSLERVNRDEKYYIPSGDVIFMVENTLFRVHQYFFVRESAYFRTTVFPSSNFRQALVGASDAHPIILSDVTAFDFARLLWVFYNEDYAYDATVEVWSSVLRIAHKWGFHKVKDLAVREMEKTRMSSVDKAVLARDCEVGNDWLVTAYAELGAREVPLTREEGLRLGLDAVIRLAEVREKIRDGRVKPPPSPPTPTSELRPIKDWTPSPQSRCSLMTRSPPSPTSSIRSFGDHSEVMAPSPCRPKPPYMQDLPAPDLVTNAEMFADTSRTYTDDDVSIVRSVCSL